MGKVQRRRSISIRPAVYDRLMHYIANADPALKLACSSVTEDAITQLLDAAGVPAKVPPYVRPSDPKPKPEHKTESDYTGSHFTF